MYLIIDTETTGLPKFYDKFFCKNWPRIIQLSWQVHDKIGNLIEFNNFIIKPKDFDIPFISFKIHRINNEFAHKYGYDLNYVLDIFQLTFNKYEYVIGHNLEFDIKIIEKEYYINKKEISFKKKKILDTKLVSINYCKLPGNRKKFKWPTLSELYHKLFSEKIPNLHNAANDVKATARCFLELLRIGIISNKNIGIKKDIISEFKKNNHYIIPSSIVSFERVDKEKILKKKTSNNILIQKKWTTNQQYFNIHNHTHFSVLNSTINIKCLIERAINLNMPAIGITDYGNMMGSFHFLNQIKLFNKKYYPKRFIKGIIGCEFFISENYFQKKFTKNEPDKIYTQVLLSKNKKGYKNLIKICSIGYTEGFYAGIPRIGKNIIKNYKDNLIALTGDINSEIPHAILNYGEKIGEKIFLWWKNLFKNDFYIELLRHGLEEENHVNEILIKFSKKYNVKYIAQNNVFYLKKEEHNAHDILLCIKSGNKQSIPIGKGKGFRFGFKNHEYYLKNHEEMKKIFSDIPDSFHSLNELIQKIECYDISNKILLPKFKTPKYVKNLSISDHEFLSKLTYEGAEKRYKNITTKIKKRILFELNTIKKIGYPGYFLIIKNIVDKAKELNISVGPGRGSSAGSVVAYCLGITEIDPIKYNLLFERFLNPDRISLPDIDIDFDDKGREKILDWISKKYGKNKVAQIVTYSTMGAKSSIRDTGRVLGLSLYETDRIAKMIPINFSLKNILDKNFSFENIKNKEVINNIKKIIEIYNNKHSLSGRVLIQAKILEGTIRNIGIHACGIIISPYDIKEIIPVFLSKDTNLLVTQFDNNVVEQTGLLKMDFLGLKTLSIIKDTIKIIGSNIKFLLNDEKTFNLFKKGETVAVFQYESTGMQKYLRKLKPDRFDDLIAMNALYRPGPLQYIPNFISRKHGKEIISYDLPEMKEFLEETYGITIYQEQVMLLSQKIAGFSKGEADLLRKSMGKKQKEVLDKMKNYFIKKSINRGYDKNIVKKIWRDWEYFSCYAFNKSHATCYAFIAFKTAYLKAHFPCQYMSSVLSNNMNNIKQLTFFMKECKKMNLFIDKPDINESDSNFRIIGKNRIQFGLNGIKGVGENAVRIILKERNKNGKFSSIFNLVNRIDLRVVNKKILENLVLSGSLDSLNILREQYFYEYSTNEELIKSSTLEKIIQFGSKIKKNKKIEKPIILNDSKNKKWNKIDLLCKEKEVLGIYISSHPLDDYFFEIKYLTNSSISKLNRKEYDKHEFYYYTLAAILSDIKIYVQNGKKYGYFLLEDYNSKKEFKISGEKYIKYESILVKNNLLFVVIYKKENKINIFHIEILQNVFKNLVKKIIIKINIHHLNQLLIDLIEENIIKNLGNKKLDIIIYDNKKFINLHSKYKIDINSNFLKKLEKIKKLDFFLC
ncbi:DNA polymerase III subunit alpha [Blattabacterium cuenoti]|uniref:DNA polymerase III subunit alpha n=1 Tax=Blattabacterium cuenoti TaxID=1653831 RepID=UPI00163BF0C7|nr:DNA polymerase III subunit alpha [Blattabacterium cuenoti]